MVRILKKLRQDNRGATAIEYGLILALIFLAMVTALESFGATTISMWDNIGKKVESARK